MNAPSRPPKSPQTPPAAPAPVRVVAAVYSPASLAAALALAPVPAAPDWLELRVDHFSARPGRLDALVARAPRPFVVTVRHPAEGGAPGAPGDAARRRELYERFLPGAAAVDIEVRSLRALDGVVRAARGGGCRVVASCHDFQGMPTAGRLRSLVTRAVDAGADIFKVAATVGSPGQLARLLDFMESEKRLPLAVMGMGPLGRVSRLVLAAAGSVLNYGYLGRGPQVPGQWPADLLRARIDELRETRTAPGGG